jgi:homoserine kinase type II
MAVFTEVPFDEAARLLNRLQLGRLGELQGIAAGIENTNYFATTDQGRYVLTVFERLSFEQLPFYLYLMKHLAERGIPVPAPQADASGELLHTVQGKPAAVVERLSGGHRLSPNADHCTRVGAMLARMHLAGQDYPRQQANLRGLTWWTQTVPVVLPFLSATQASFLCEELHYQQQLASSAVFAQLPRGPVHADLFRDNVLFDQLPNGVDQLSGFFDFYFAANDVFLFDLGVTLNDWCVDLDSGVLVEDRAQALLAAYDEVRPLHSAELRLLPAMMRAAALRFWISRLWDKHLPRDAALLSAHDPAHFERVLRCRVEQPWHYLRP